MKDIHVKINDDGKIPVVLNLLKELPFVEVEEESETRSEEGKNNQASFGDLADIFGIWEKREITLESIREKAWKRQ